MVYVKVCLGETAVVLLPNTNILPSIDPLTLEYMYSVDELRSAFDIFLGTCEVM